PYCRRPPTRSHQRYLTRTRRGRTLRRRMKPAHTTATSVLTCNLEPLLPCTHRSYIVLLGLNYFFIHVLHDPVSEHHSWVIHRWTYSIVTVPEVLCTPIHDEFNYSHKWKTQYPTHDHVI